MRSVIDLIVNYYISESLEHILSENNNVYVTELVSCPLKYWLRLRYPTLALQLSFNEKVLLGKIIHLGIEELLDEISLDYNEYIETEKAISKNIDGLHVVGRADIVGKNYVVEIKTTRTNVEDLPYKHHVEQTRMYANLLDKEHAILLYIVTNNKPRFVEFTYDKMSDEELHKYIDELRNKEPSPRFPWECRYCIFKSVCPKAGGNNA